ncbi:syntaxin-16 [Planococcus citri]|uniref:syntaxin-16 n=1 Tax=Planococcus citri TaxID=170843 RepID=UPI0031F9F034
MVTRQLTDVFTLMRNNANHNRNILSEQIISDRMALVESGEGMDMSRTALPPSWINILEEAQFQISRIQKKLNDLSTQQQSFLSKPTLDDSTEQETHIEHLSQEVTKLFSITQKLIHQIEEQSMDGSTQERKLSKNVTSSLCTTLQNLSFQFRNLQSSYLNKLKSREERSNVFFQDDVFYDDNDPFESLNEGELKVDREFELGPRFTEQQKQQLLFEEDNARMAAQRKQEVNQIVSSIADLNYIFKDLGRMVAEQGTVLDRIDYNIEQTQTQVRHAYQELARADRYQRKNRKMQCILILAPATVILFLLLIAVKF